MVILGDMYELGKHEEKEHEKVIKLCNSKKIDKCIFIGQIFYRLKNNNSSNYFYKNNFNATKNIVEFCNKTKAKLIFASSTSVYGPQSNKVDELCGKHDLNPQSPSKFIYE